jgi:hypothetical protein
MSRVEPRSSYVLTIPQRSIRHNLSLKAMFMREERPQSDPGKGYYWTLNTAMGEGNKRDRKRKRDGQHIKDEEEDTDFSSESQAGHNDAPSPSSSSHHHRQQHPRPGHPQDAPVYMHGQPQQGMMHGQAPYMGPPSLMFNQPAPGGPSSYNAGPQNMPFQTGHAGPGFSASPAWGGPQPLLNPQTGMFVVPPPLAAQGHYQQQQQQQPGSSHRRGPTGGMGSTRPQQQAGFLSHTVPMQGDFMPSTTGGVSQSSRKSSRRSHSDTSPEDDEDERARSVPRPRSGHRS